MEKKQQKEVAAAIKALAAVVRSFPPALKTCHAAFQTFFAYLDASQSRLHAGERNGDTTADIVQARTRLTAMLTSLIAGFQEADIPVVMGTYEDIVSVKITQPLGRLYHALDVVPKTPSTRSPEAAGQALTRQATRLPAMSAEDGIELVRASLNSFVLLVVTTSSEMAVIWSNAKKAFTAGGAAEGVTFESGEQGSTPTRTDGRSVSAPQPGPATAQTYNSSAAAAVNRTTSELQSSSGSTEPLLSSHSQHSAEVVKRLMEAAEDAVLILERVVSRAVKAYADLAHRLVMPHTVGEECPSLLSDDSASASLGTTRGSDSVSTVPHAALAQSVAARAVPSKKITSPSSARQFVQLTDDLAADCGRLLSPARFSYTGGQLREKVVTPLIELHEKREATVRRHQVASEKMQRVAPHVSAALSNKRLRYFESFYAGMGTATLALAEIESEIVTHLLRVLTPYVI